MAIRCANACTYRKADGICQRSICYFQEQNIQIATKMRQNRQKASFYTADGVYFGSVFELCSAYGIKKQRFLDVLKASNNDWVYALNFCVQEQKDLAMKRAAQADATLDDIIKGFQQYNDGNNMNYEDRGISI